MFASMVEERRLALTARFWVNKELTGASADACVKRIIERLRDQERIAGDGFTRIMREEIENQKTLDKQSGR